MLRRSLVLGGCAAGGALASRPLAAPTVLLRSGWQSVNIGDIAHTPGGLALLGSPARLQQDCVETKYWS